MFNIKTCFYALPFFAAGIAFASCNNAPGNNVPPVPADDAQPVVQPLKFSKPKKTIWAEVKAVAVSPRVTNVNWDKLPEQAYDTTGAKPFAYPVEETKFNPGTLPERDLDIDKLPSHPLKFKTYILPQPKLIKGAKLQFKGGNLYLLGFGEDQQNPGIAISALLQDRDGFLWIACSRGIYRFDGENLLLFLSNPDSNNCYGMLQDNLGNIWMTDSFGPLEILDPKGGILKKSMARQGLDGLHRLMLDQQQRVWANSDSGVVKIIDPKVQTVKTLDQAHGLFTSNRTVGLLTDKSGNIWISQGGGGLNILDLKNKKIKHLDQAHGLSSDRINNIFCDSIGRLWIGIYGGLVNVIDLQKDSIQTIRELQSAAPRMYVISLSQDGKGRIWIATGANGIGIIDPLQRSIIHLKKNSGLASDDVYDINHDNRGQVWIGAGSGLNMISGNKGILAHIGKDSTYNLIEDRQGLIWQATDHGVNILDRKKKTKRHLGVEQGLANDVVHFIKETKEGFYISTDSSLEILDTVRNTITHLSSSYSNILFDKAGRVWYLDGTERGINMYDPKSKTIKHFGKDELQLDGFIYFMCMDARGRIWLSAADGQVEVIDPDAGTVQFLTNIVANRNHNIVHFLPDNSGNIWMGTETGIYIADLKKQTLIYFSTAQGLINNDVFSMVQYKGSVYAGTKHGVTVITPPAEGVSAKRKWQVVSYGINERHPVSDCGDLVTRDGFYWSGAVGTMVLDLSKKNTFESSPYITGISESDRQLNFFDQSRFSASVTDTLWELNEKKYYLKDRKLVNSNYASQIGLNWDHVTGPGNMPVNLQVPFDQNFIRFHYNSLNLTPHDTAVYRYILVGVDKKWSDETSETSSINYMNLQPENYTFAVTSRNANYVWSRPVKFSFTITPPWWQTWWAYITYAALFAGAVFAFVRYRSLQLVKEKRVLEDKVHLATEEIMQQKEEIAAQRDNLEYQRNDLERALAKLKATQTQLIQSEKMASLGELTAGIAHEIQNPLNFVNNFSEVNREMIDELKEELKNGNVDEALAIADDIQQNEEKINHHGKRADGIVKGMLEHSRTGSGTKEPTDINALADEYLRLSYHGLRAKDKSFNAELITHFNPGLPKISVIQQDMGRVMLNLFNNAFYAVSQKKKTAGADYKPEVSVSTSTENGQIIIKVNDNGIGIPDAIKDKIIQPFFTTKPTGEGTGLGLSLSYDMVVKGHGGNLQVNSAEGEGSEFIIQLPIN
jgi:signal transduction histidine kinase/ligand-binding sensor domain-containing protein